MSNRNIVETEVAGIKFNLRKVEKNILVEIFDEDIYRVSEIPKESLVVDIGAHIGGFSLRCAKERACKVYAYEPCPSTFRLLVKNIKLNNLTHKVKAFNIAVGKFCETRKFYFKPQHPAGSSFYPSDQPTKTIQVESTNLRMVFQNNNISICDVLKVDCESAEKEIFVEEFAYYFKRVKLVMLEWHNYDGEKYSRYLSQLGFWTLLTGTGKPLPCYNPIFAGGMLYAKKDRKTTV